MKKLKIEIKGMVMQVQVQDAEKKRLKAWNGMFPSPEPEIQVGDRKYTSGDLNSADRILAPEVIKNHEVFLPMDLIEEYYLTDTSCKRGILIGGEGRAYVTISIEDDENFDPKKACFIYSKMSAYKIRISNIITGFCYDDHVYDLEEANIENVQDMRWIWNAPLKNSVRLCQTPTVEMDEILAKQGDRLPVLVFRTLNIVNNENKFFVKAIDLCEPLKEKWGVVALTDYDTGGRVTSEVGFLETELNCIMNYTDFLEPDPDDDIRARNMVAIDVADEYLVYFNCKRQKPYIWPTIAAVWPKSKNFTSIRPQVPKLLIRQLEYLGKNSESQEADSEEGRYGNTYTDYLLLDGKMCRIPPTYIDGILASVAENEGTGVKVKDGERLLPESYLNLVKLGSKEDLPYPD